VDARRQIETTKVDDGRFGKMLAVGDDAARVERGQDADCATWRGAGIVGLVLLPPDQTRSLL
jgi:hypothetical protein